VSFFTSLPGRIVSAISGLGRSVAGVFSSMYATVSGAIGSFISSVASLFASLPGKIVAALGNIGSQIVAKIKDGLPGVVRDALPFANGGIVTGPTRALIGEAGKEVVVPMMRPARAVELAQQSGLVDLLKRHGALGGAAPTHNWNIAAPNTDGLVLAQHLYGHVARASGI
jgi:hypothetical protein